MPYVIAINSVSGGGKTSLARLLHQSLVESTLFCFDDFDSTNIYPNDFYQWWKAGGDHLGFDCPGMGQAVETEIKQGKSKIIVLDYPFGRHHPRFAKLIDLSVFVDTPLDIALARRILRECGTPTNSSPEEWRQCMRKGLTHYLEKGRVLYVDTGKHKGTSDLVLDGRDSLKDLSEKIRARLHAAGF